MTQRKRSTCKKLFRADIFLLRSFTLITAYIMVLCYFFLNIHNRIHKTFCTFSVIVMIPCVHYITWKLNNLNHPMSTMISTKRLHETFTKPKTKSFLFQPNLIVNLLTPKKQKNHSSNIKSISVRFAISFCLLSFIIAL